MKLVRRLLLKARGPAQLASEETNTGNDYKLLYEQMKMKMELLRLDFRATEAQYEEVIIEHSRSHQETVDKCVADSRNEREKRKELHKGIRAII